MTTSASFPLSRRTALRATVVGAAGAAVAGVALTDTAAAAQAPTGHWAPARSATLRAPLRHVPVRVSNGEVVDIAYRLVGSGRPLVLLQRFRGTLDLWDPLFVDLLARRRQVLLFDAPGVGGSGGSVPQGISAMADDAAAVVRALGLERAGQARGAGVDVLGWSMGGMVAQALAVRHPGLVRRLVLDGTTPPGNPDLVRPSEAWVQVAVKPTYSFEDVVRLFYTQSGASRSAAAASEARIAARRDPVPPVAPASVGAQATAVFAYYDDAEKLFARLRTIAAPVFIGAGDHDDAFPVRDSTVLLEQIPGALLDVYPDSGHGFQFQYPVEFTRRVTTFLD